MIVNKEKKHKDFSVLICDDHAILLEGLKVCLMRIPGVKNVKISNTMRHAMEQLKAVPKTDLCIVDLDLPDGSGIELIAYAKQLQPNIRTLVYTSHEEIWNINAVMHSGTDAVVFKSCEPCELQYAVESVMNGDTYFCKRFQQLVRHIEMHIPDSSEHLTSQEKNVLCQLARGLRANEIADALHVSVNTINTHKAHLLSKFNATNTTELIIKAFVKGMVELKI